MAAKRAAKAAQKAAKRGTNNPVADATQRVQEATAWVEEHGKKIWIGLGALLVIGVAWVLLARYLTTKDNDAGAALRSAVTISQGIVVAPDDTAPEDVIVPTFSSAQERATKALASYQDVVKKYGSSAAGHYALLGVANSQLELGKYAEAATNYAKVLEAAGNDSFLRSRALEGSGYALEAQQKYPEALARFEELSKLSNGTFRSLGDYHRARVLVAQGKPAEARALLEALSKALAATTNVQERERFESSVESAETLLQELGGKPTDKPRDLSGSGLSQDVLDALRKQLASQPEKTP
ncbi:MAG TPA: tetratricopeptide repeat protein [Polyangiales bacterium]|nr:tetratricopeptide repeat protein [Polyangiales bacterium]